MQKRGIVSEAVQALGEEPKLRTFAAASLVDDIGVAVSTWAMALLETNLFTSQRARASFVIPGLVCFLAGTVISGPLADWAERFSLLRLARWRWRLVAGAHLLQMAVLGTLLFALVRGEPTIASVLPFWMFTAFMKTALRPTRIAFGVDLLRVEAPRLGPDGQPMRDERGAPLLFKTHLLTMTSLLGTLAATATLVGLVLGGRILELAGGRSWLLFAVQAVCHLASFGVVFWTCHPQRAPRDVSIRELFVDVPEPGEEESAVVRQTLSFVASVRHFFVSLWEGARFMARRDQRTLLLLLAGAALVEFVTESYDGKMIVKHVLGGADDDVRHAEIAWSVVGLVVVAALPALSRALGSIGRIFVLTMLVDGVLIALAGRAAMGGTAAILPFAVILSADHALTLASTSLVEIAQNSASSAAMRGRIAAAYAFFVILGDMATEGLATAASEALGIPKMLVAVGILQVVVVVGLLAAGGRSLLRFGLRAADHAG